MLIVEVGEDDLAVIRSSKAVLGVNESQPKGRMPLSSGMPNLGDALGESDYADRGSLSQLVFVLRCRGDRRRDVSDVRALKFVEFREGFFFPVINVRP